MFDIGALMSTFLEKYPYVLFGSIGIIDEFEQIKGSEIFPVFSSGFAVANAVVV